MEWYQTASFVIFFLVLAWLASQIAALQSARAEDEAFKKRMRERFVRSGKDAWANKMELENKLGYSRETNRPPKPDADPGKIAAAYYLEGQYESFKALYELAGGKPDEFVAQTKPPR